MKAMAAEVFDRPHSPMLRLTAPAKINLALHVTGQRDDGYHLLDTLVVFTRFGDRLSAEAAYADRLTVGGPQGMHLDDLASGDNLVARARDRLRAAILAHGGSAPPVALHLDKHLPVASGMGGGSSDGATTLHALSQLWPDSARLGAGDWARLTLELGADVPMCHARQPVRASGIGEALAFVATMPALPLLLVNPGVHVATPAIFRALASKTNAPMTAPPMSGLAADWIAWLGAQRNDLQDAAIEVEPMVGQCLDALAQTRGLLARMTGSGATCFSIHETLESAQRAREMLASAHPDWFLAATLTHTSPAA